MYKFLGEDGVIYGISQTKVKTVITSQELLPKLAKILDRVSDVKNVVYFENRSGKKLDLEVSGVKWVAFSKVILNNNINL